MGASPAPVLTSFEGGRALSDFRAVGLLRRLRDRVPTITGVTARHVHWVASATPLDADTHTRVAHWRCPTTRSTTWSTPSPGWAATRPTSS
jgi:hypothetical protein